MPQFLTRAWNHRFMPGRPWYVPVLLVALAVVGLAYPLVEVLWLNYPDFGLDEYVQVRAASDLPAGAGALRRIFMPLWLGMAVACVAFRTLVIWLAYRKTLGEVDRDRFHRDFMVYLQATVIALLATLGTLWLLNLALYASGWFPAGNADIFSLVLGGLRDGIVRNVPTVVEVGSYPVAILCMILGLELGTWFIHWLTHRSRLLWLVLHRAHHCAETYHPLANAPAFVFDFALALPKVAVMATWSKLFHAEPLVLEGAIWFLAGYFIEIFNHAEAFYPLAHRNPILRGLCMLTGHGVYHMLHHSSAKEHQMVNLAGGPFNLVDRVLGTYATPPAQTPRFGLTHNPELHMNPLRVVFGGLAQVLWELRHNRGWGTRLRILLGSVHYCPPHSKDFLIEGYPDPKP